VSSSYESLDQLVIKLIEGIYDAKVRMDIASIVYGMRDSYASGQIDDEELKNDLILFCTDVYQTKYIDKEVEELRDQIEDCAKRLFRAIKLETIRARFFERLRR
jgi:hypothetical protein